MTLDADGEGSAQEPTVTIEEEMGRSFLSYGMSVIVSRALPDVRDGLKPVHRRIVYAMQDGGYHAGKAYKKSARIVGDVMGKYHPHGDSAIYDTMVRMAQPWSMRLPLIDGQGNYGSVDNDPPAAMRYTEARMSKAAHDLVADIDKDVVAFGPNYDGSAKEPAVVPARFPNLLVNGGTGIAVGMASNIPPHNLGEAIDACLLVLDDPDCALDALMAAMPGPDFPTAGVIKGRKGIREAYETGRGSITVSGVWSIEDAKGGRRRIVITELPYMVVKKALIEHVAALVNEKEIEGVSDVRDESDRTGMRIVIDLKREADANVVAALVAKRTDLVANFSVNATCIDQHRRPRTMGVKEMLSAFVDFRKEVVRRRTAHELGRARDRLHVVVGLYAAVSNLDRVVALIRGASDQDDARSKLVAETFSTQGGLAALILESDPEAEAGETFSLSEIQAKAILEMRLSRLTGLEREKIAGEARELSVEIAVHLGILNEPARLKDVVRNELAAAKAAYPMERLTRIEAAEMDEVSEDELIAREEVVITLTHGGYVKRTPLDAYRAQRRNGKGKSGMETKDDDFVVATAVCTTHTPLTFFTDRGIAHSLKAHKLPDAPPNAKGRPIVNFVPLLPEERVATLVAMPETEADLAGRSLMFFTDFGTVRRNAASDFAGINKAGKIAIKLDDASGNPQGKLVGVELCGDDADVMVVTRNGMAVRFHVDDVRTMQSRESTGVRAVNLAFGDAVVGASVLKRFEASTAEREAYLAGGSTAVREDDGAERQVTLAPERMAEMAAAEQFLLTVSERGFGKRSSSHDYRTTLRGGKGITAMAINKATGPVAACFPVEAGDDVVVVTNAGQTIRTPVDGIRVQGRNTRGVGVIKLDDGQRIVDVARVEGDGSAEG